MKSKTEWANIIYRDRLEEDKVYLHVDRMCAEYDKALRAIIIQMSHERATNGGSSPHLWLDQVDDIIAEAKVVV